MGSTNYVNTFIQIADDCPVKTAEEPVVGSRGPTVATLQFAMLTARPYELTSDDVVFDVYAQRQGIPASDYDAVRADFFAKGQACLRASPLGKRYGWGIHHDEQGRVALVPVGSTRYEQLSSDPSIKQVKAMASKRR